MAKTVEYNGVLMQSTNKQIFDIHTLDYIERNSFIRNLLLVSSTASAVRVDLWSLQLLNNTTGWYYIYAANPEYGRNIFNIFNIAGIYDAKYIRVPVSGTVDYVITTGETSDQYTLDLSKLPKLNYNFIG